eukprot:GGOE01062134.1.p1 GENE.GGOE01062134.1~~GGOE01062134.1.p1  ORF type:complete len:608 (+),score=200.43 GGOE01062134.1:161-1984(+)
MEYQTPGGSLSNQDFKKLMMTPRRPSTEETPVPDYLARKRRKREGMRIDTAEVFARPQKKAEEVASTYHRSTRESRYRDRAGERRVGENPDYADDNKMLREAGLPERKKEVLDTPLYQTPNKHSAMIGGATPQYTPSYTPAPQSLAFATPAPGQSTSVGGTTVTRLSSSAMSQPSAPPATAAAAAASSVLPDAVAERRNFEIREQIEKSKYLGGDVKHTHLVRGLDFALLQKVRQEIVMTEKEREEKKEKEEKAKKEANPPADAPKPFQTLLGERLHDALFGWQSRKVDTFLPGRTFYVIDFDENASDVPITQYRPRHELDLSAEDQHNAGLPRPLLEQIMAVCQDRQKGLYGPMKERKKREREKELQRQRDEEEKKRLQQALHRSDDRAKPRDAGMPLPDEDIFPDAGEYQPDTGRDPQAPTLAERSSGPLFRDLRDAKLREEKEAQALQDRLRAHAKAHSKVGAAGGAKGSVPVEDDPFSLNDIQLPSPKTRPSGHHVTASVTANHARVGHLGPAPVGDYDECYPGAQHDDDAVYDDMNLKEKDVMDGRRAAKRKRRSDFATEEEWSQYNLNREALPKAAFQYQKKMDDGRVTRRAKHRQGGDSD